MNKSICGFCGAKDIETENDHLELHNYPDTKDPCFGSNNLVARFPPPNFTSDEKEALKSWGKQRRDRFVYMENYQKTGNLKQLVKELESVDGQRCEHDRSIWGSCADCIVLNDKIAMMFGIVEEID